MNEMKAYIGVKVVNAVSATLLEHNLDQGGTIDPDVYPDPTIDGYQVVYEDGYISWSPAGTFENSNREMNGGCMPFGHALEAAKLGYCLSRKHWGGKFMFMCPHARSLYDDPDINIDLPYLSVATDDGHVQTGWIPDQADMLSDDWQTIGAVDAEIIDTGFLMNGLRERENGEISDTQLPDVEASVVTGAVLRGSQILATLKHDAGAYGLCSCCRRYSDNKNCLNDGYLCRNCGKVNSFSGSFFPPDESSQWDSESGSDAVLQLSNKESESLYTVFSQPIDAKGDNQLECVDRDLSSSAAQSLCHTEGEKLSDDYTVWMVIQ